MRRDRFVEIKLQSTLIEQFRYDTGPGDTVGKLVDRMIEQSRANGHIPTKLAIDLNPKSDEIDPEV